MELALVPWPTEVTETGAGFRLIATTGVAAGAGTEGVADLLSEELGLTAGDGISLALDDALPREGYRLSVSPDGVRITGGDPAGVFYGTRTLLQLLPPEVYAAGRPDQLGWTVPGVEITDRPAYGWRGAMLDVGRHFQPKDVVLRFIDLLAMHKLNVFHWHLTESQGWRIEIKRHPRLTEVGAWRSETLVGHVGDVDPATMRYDGTPHGGFYTQDEIREVVAYAARRFVTVVPEIDLPGHTDAAIASYPELGNTGAQLDVARRWGVSANVLNVEDSTIEFFKDVLTEVLDLFPSEFIHVGGDECPKTQWHDSVRAQRRILELGLADEDELQSWFIRQFDDFLTSHGRRLLGWDEILEGGLAPGAAVMSWRGEQGGIEAAKAGHDVVMTPWSHVYFDHCQAEDASTEPLSIGGFTSLEKVHGYQPVPAELAGSPAADRVLGSQFNLWTEYIPTAERLDYMAFPRGAALAEVVWSTDRPSYADFLGRLRGHLRRLDARGVRYRPLD